MHMPARPQIRPRAHTAAHIGGGGYCERQMGLHHRSRQTSKWAVTYRPLLFRRVKEKRTTDSGCRFTKARRLISRIVTWRCCTCLCSCLCTHLYTCPCTCQCTCLWHACAHVYKHACTHACTHACDSLTVLFSLTSLHACRHVYRHMCTDMCAGTYTNMCAGM